MSDFSTDPVPVENSVPAPVVPPSDAVLHEANALLDEIEAEIAAIDRALKRIDTHSYGTCEVCGAAIEAQLLATDPTQVRCAEHVTSAARLFPSGAG